LPLLGRLPVKDRTKTGRRSYYTTFEISALCEVNPTTVQNWVKEKKLRAYATPGGHRRIRHDDLVSFLKHFGMPLPQELQRQRGLVLIVDDEKEVCEMLQSMMESWDEGIEVVGVPGGVEALLFIGERKPDLVVLDIMMPGMNGIEVCRKLKVNPATQDIKIVAITGRQEPGLRERILEAGADMFFTKPFDFAEFRAASVELLGSLLSRRKGETPEGRDSV
jgi:excisionase family DNA binding protein